MTTAKHSFSPTQVGLYSVRGKTPAVRYVSLVEDGGDSPTPLDLVDALPLGDFLAPLAECKESMGAAIDLLQPEGSGFRARDASLDFDDPQAPSASRGLGGSLQVQIELQLPLSVQNAPL